MSKEPYLISPQLLKSIQIGDAIDRELLLDYTKGLMHGAKTPELRIYWTIINKWANKHFITKHFTEEDDEAIP